MTKFLKIISLIIVFWVCNFLPLHALQGIVNSITYDYVEENNEITITKITPYKDAIQITIPETFNNIPITTIGPYAMTNEKNVKTIIIPNTVRKIRNGAFANCTSLSTVKLSDSITTISPVTFSNCVSLSSINIPESVTLIGKNAFYNCTKVAKVSFASWDSYYNIKYENISSNPLATSQSYIDILINGESLTNIEIPDTFTEIPEYMFKKCKYLKTVIIPNSVKSIGNSAFNGCKNLISIIIPESVTEIGENTFSNCTSLQSITIPNSVEEVGSRAFSYCSNLKEITISEGSKQLIFNSDVFQEVKLERLFLGRNFKCSSDNEKQQPFRGKTSLIALTIGNGVTEIEAYSFAGCTNLPELLLPNSVSRLGKGCFMECESLSSLSLSTSLQSIHALAFKDCRNLKSLTIPSAVSSIEASAFLGCTSLDALYLLESEEIINLGSGVFERTAISKLYMGRNFKWDAPWISPFTESLQEVIISDSMKVIGSEAFSECLGLTSISLPQSIILIGRDAFRNCSNLTSLTIPESVVTIEARAFAGCSGITTLTLPESVNSIGREAFRGWSSLTSLSLPKTITTINGYTFADCTSLNSISIPMGVTSIDDGAFSGCSALASISIPTSVTSIGDSAFTGCGALTSISIPNGVTSIGDSAFSGCGALTSISIPNGVTSIGDSAFLDCNALTSISIPNGVTSIGDSAFSGCSALTAISIPTGVTSIGDNSFYKCSSLTSVTIPNKVTIIGRSCFDGCSKIDDVVIEDGNEILNLMSRSFGDTEIRTLHLGRDLSIATVSPPFANKKSLQRLTIGESVTSIPEKCFYGCSRLDTITIPPSVTSIDNLAFGKCASLKELKLVDGNETIKIYKQAFDECEIENIYLGRNFNSLVYDKPFENMTSLRSMSIGPLVTNIASYSFRNCVGLKHISFEDGNKPFLYDSKVFLGSKIESMYVGRDFKLSSFISTSLPSLTTLIVGNSITKIPAYTFDDCPKLKEITFNDGAEPLKVAANTFPDSNIEYIYLGRELIFEDDSPFKDMTTLRSLNVGNLVGSITNSAFTGCANLTSINLGTNLSYIGNKAFHDCNIETIFSPASEAPQIELGSFSSYTKNNGKVEIPEGSLSSYQEKWGMFKIFHSINEPSDTYIVSRPGDLINMINPDRYEKIGSLKLIGSINGTDLHVLNQCSNIHTLDLSEADIVAGGIPYYIDGTSSYTVNYNNILPYNWAYNLTNLISIQLPQSISAIGFHAFQYNNNISELVIPESVNRIEAFAFADCTSLKSVIIPNSVNTIDHYAFYNCRGLISLRIPDSVTSIAESTFNMCRNLTSVCIGKAVKSIGEDCFIYCTSLTSIECKASTPPEVATDGANIAFGSNLIFNNCTLIVPEKSVDAYKAHNIWGKFYNIMGIEEAFITSITLSPSEWCATEGDSFEIEATIYPDSASQNGIEWTSSNEVVALVNQNGIVTTLHPGECYITATAKDGSGFSTSCIVKVLEKKGGDNGQLEDGEQYLTYSYSGDEATVIGFNADSDVSVNIPTVTEYQDAKYTVTGISASAFAGKANLISVTLPSTIKTISPGAFRGCKNLTTVNYGCNYVHTSSTHQINPIFKDCSSLTDLNILPSVMSIPGYMFGAIGIKKLVIPDNVIELGNDCFAEAACLSEIHWGKGLERVECASFAFGNNSDLETTIFCNAEHLKYYRGVSGYSYPPMLNRNVVAIDFGQDVKVIGDWSFFDVETCQDIYCHGEIPPIVTTSQALQKVNKKSCVLHVPSQWIKEYQNAPFWSDFFTIKGDIADLVALEEIEAATPSSPIDIYSISGLLISKKVSTDYLNRIHPGIYIIRQGSSVRKIHIQ